MPKRIQLRRTAGWRKPTDARVVARPSRWGNPHRVTRCANGSGRPYWQIVTDVEREYHAIRFSEAEARELAVDEFRRDIERGVLDLDLTPLRGRDLACWCPLDGPCHADVLLEVANAEPKPCSCTWSTIAANGPLPVPVMTRRDARCSRHGDRTKFWRGVQAKARALAGDIGSGDGEPT